MAPRDLNGGLVTVMLIVAIIGAIALLAGAGLVVMRSP